MPTQNHALPTKKQFMADVKVEQIFITSLLDSMPCYYRKQAAKNSELENINEGYVSFPKFGDTTRASTHEELRARLEEKIKLLRGKRKSSNILERRKAKKKLDRLGSKNKVVIKPIASRAAIKAETSPLMAPKTKPIFNKEGKMVYNKFDFHVDTVPKSKPQGKKNDYKKILNKLQERKNKVQEFKNKGEHSKAESLVEKTIWKSAMLKAEGMKVKDDPELLKKSIKRKESMKKRSAKKWKDRLDVQKKMQDARQKKRQENIKARKQDKTKRKISKAVKKGRLVPGFK